MSTRMFMSPPHMGPNERHYLEQAFSSNWIAPLGPFVDRFENSFKDLLGCRDALVVSSGTAGLHLALLVCGVGPGDEVLCSSLTFVASANPILQVGARPIFVDSELSTWNLDPRLVVAELDKRARSGKLPKAIIVVHVYGQTADLDPILDACAQYGVHLIEDAAEALGATYKGRPAGTFGRIGVFSFNGNKIITTSGGGMLVSDDEGLVARARFLSTQAKEAAPHYEHVVSGFNYRLSNLLAAVGVGQMEVLAERISSRRSNFEFYREHLGTVDGIEMMPRNESGFATNWLSCLTVDPKKVGCSARDLIDALARENIEARRLWKPMHLQPLFSGCAMLGGAVSEHLFEQGLCLPSGSAMSRDDLERVIGILLRRIRSKQ